MSVKDLAALILTEVGADFKSKGLDSTSLHQGYVGVSIAELEAKIAAHGKIDFELALLQLEKDMLVGTGPWAPRDSKEFLILPGLYNKREYIWLMEKGYRELQKRPARKNRSHPTVNISGSQFYQSPIGVGATVHQTVTFQGQKDLEDLQRLVKVFETHLDDLPLETSAKRKVVAQVSTIKAQLEDEPDPVIVRQAGRTLRNVTEGTIASLIATAATTPGIWEWVDHAMRRLFAP